MSFLDVRPLSASSNDLAAELDIGSPLPASSPRPRSHSPRDTIAVPSRLRDASNVALPIANHLVPSFSPTAMAAIAARPMAPLTPPGLQLPKKSPPREARAFGTGTAESAVQLVRLPTGFDSFCHLTDSVIHVSLRVLPLPCRSANRYERWLPVVAPDSRAQCFRRRPIAVRRVGSCFFGLQDCAPGLWFAPHLSTLFVHSKT